MTNVSALGEIIFTVREIVWGLGEFIFTPKEIVFTPKEIVFTPKEIKLGVGKVESVLKKIVYAPGVIETRSELI